MSYGYSRPVAELERSAPRPNVNPNYPQFYHLGLSIERWVLMTVTFEIGKALYGLGRKAPKTRPAMPRVRGVVSSVKYRALAATEARLWGIPVDAILKPNRKRGAVALARFRVWRELRRQGASFPAIGRAAGRDHSTILYGILRLESLEHALSGAAHVPSHYKQRLDRRKASGVA